ncbi:MAG TPA: AMP-binding protein [Acidimicrobiia bacterium]|nr:AMP-binding protein [Acidimicrobiia bacterium]
MNLADVLLASAATTPDATALLLPDGTPTTYGDLADQAARLGTLLVEAGVSPGDRVAVVSLNTTAFVAAYLAALQVGAVCVPLNPAAPPAGLDRELNAIDPVLALAAGSAVSLVEAAGHPVSPIDLTTLPAAPAARVERDPDDLAVLLFTSGTVGSPRAARLTHANLAANVAQVQDHPGLRLEPHDVGMALLPCFHIFGLNVILGVGLAAGAATVLVERFDAAATARVAHDRGVTILAGVPAMFHDWAELAPDEVPLDAFASVRLAVSGAAPLPGTVAAAFQDRFGLVLHQGYGLTEASPIVTSTALCDHPPRPGSIGPPVPGVAVRLVDTAGADVLAGDPGELWVQGPNVFPGYWHDDRATAQALTPDGWLRTGDVAVVEDDGDLRLVDRLKDLIIVSGFNVYPVEVEDVLRTHPGVHEVGVVGAPSPRTGEAVVAFVVPTPGAPPPDPTDLAAHCARSLPRYKCPTRYESVPELPRNPAGKLLRRALLDQRPP